MIRHIVLFKLKNPTTEVVNETVAKLRSLEGKVESLIALEIGADILRTERSSDVALTATFETLEGLQAYQVHPEHVKIIEYMGSVTESSIAADYEY